MEILIVVDREQFAQRFARTLTVYDYYHNGKLDSLPKCLWMFCEYLYNRVVLAPSDPSWVLRECCDGNLNLVVFNPKLDHSPMYQEEVMAFEADIQHMVDEALRQFKSNGSTLDEILPFTDGSAKIGLVLVASLKS